jgi:hypothetical protein
LVSTPFTNRQALKDIGVSFRSQNKNIFIKGAQMSISRFSEIESQINQYFKAQNTLALADSTKSLYNAVIRKKLLPFCREQGIDKLKGLGKF